MRKLADLDILVPGKCFFKKNSGEKQPNLQGMVRIHAYTPKSLVIPAATHIVSGGITRRLESCSSAILKVTCGLKESICSEPGLNEI